MIILFLLVLAMCFALFAAVARWRSMVVACRVGVFVTGVVAVFLGFRLHQETRYKVTVAEREVRRQEVRRCLRQAESALAALEDGVAANGGGARLRAAVQLRESLQALLISVEREKRPFAGREAVDQAVDRPSGGQAELLRAVRLAGGLVKDARDGAGNEEVVTNAVEAIKRILASVRAEQASRQEDSASRADEPFGDD